MQQNLSFSLGIRSLNTFHENRTGLLLPAAKSMTNVFSSKDEYCTKRCAYKSFYKII